MIFGVWGFGQVLVDQSFEGRYSLRGWGPRSSGDRAAVS